jgi:hypothetical protein
MIFPKILNYLIGVLIIIGIMAVVVSAVSRPKKDEVGSL